MQAKFVRTIFLVASVGAVLLLSACATRPEESELTASIQRAAAAEERVTLTPEQATCISQWILASDLSDTTLAGLAKDFDNPEVLETEVNKVEPLVTEAATQCRG